VRKTVLSPSQVKIGDRLGGHENGDSTFHGGLRFKLIIQDRNKLLASLRLGDSICNRVLKADNSGVLARLCAYKQSTSRIRKASNLLGF
jgi:hypothetical protein